MYLGRRTIVSMLNSYAIPTRPTTPTTGPLTHLAKVIYLGRREMVVYLMTIIAQAMSLMMPVTRTCTIGGSHLIIFIMMTIMNNPILR